MVLILWQMGLIWPSVPGIELMMPLLRSIRVAIPRYVMQLCIWFSAAASVAVMCKTPSTGGACRQARLRGWRRRCAMRACSAARASPRCARPCRSALRLSHAEQLCFAGRNYAW